MNMLDRAGHLSELALDRYRYDPPATDRSWMDAHLAECSECRAALLDLAHEDAAVVVPEPRDPNVVPLRPPLSKTPTKPRATAWWAGAGAALAAAAVAFVVTRPGTTRDPGVGPEGDRYHLKSGPFDFEVFVHDGSDSRPVLSGDVVHPGERMGFRVRTRELGYLLVLGRDDSGNRYVCYPGGDVAAAAAVPVPESPEPQVLPLAMRFDDVLGSEHIMAVFCPGPFSAGDLGDGGLGSVDMRAEGCITYELTLLKRPREGGP